MLIKASTQSRCNVKDLEASSMRPSTAVRI
jgi:hypothetical protein